MESLVIANVYRLIVDEGSAAKQRTNSVLESLGIGVYHVGIEYRGREYSFGMDPRNSRDPTVEGIFTVAPRTAVGSFLQSVTLGEALPQYTTKEGYDALMRDMRASWKAVTYHLLTRNCCHFSYDFATRLNPAFDAVYPKFTMRVSSLGDRFLPSGLVSSLTEKLAPPVSIPSELIGRLDGRLKGPVPESTSEEISPLNLTEVFEAATSARRTSVLDRMKTFVSPAASAQADYDRLFPMFSGAHRVACRIDCKVIHAERIEQRAEVFLTDRGIALSGPNGLAAFIPIDDVAAVAFGIKIEAEQAGHMPCFAAVPAEVPVKQLSSLLLVTKNFGTVPLFDIEAASAVAAVQHTFSAEKMTTLLRFARAVAAVKLL